MKAVKRRSLRLIQTMLLSGGAVTVTAQTVAPTITPAQVTEQQLNAVPVTRVVTPGFVVPGTPTTMNASITLRYGSSKPRSILLLMPGYLGGAGSFDRLARQIVALDASVGVWAVDRRANLLEPQDTLRRANRTQLESIAVSGLPVLPPAQVNYLKDWGLNVTLQDWRAAVLEARKVTPRVFIGGHSLGANLTGLYAAYDFQGQRGYDDVRGLVMLDGFPGMLSVRPMTRQEYDESAVNMIGVQPGLKRLAEQPYVDDFYFGPKLASRAAAQARLAADFPEQPAPQGAFLPWPATNLAAAMSTITRRYTQVPFLAITAGHATNVQESANPWTRLLGGQDSKRMTGPTDARRLIGWQMDAQAVTDARDFARRFWTPLADASEWYFPQRLTLDVTAAMLDTRGTPFEQDFPVLHNAAVKLPLLGISAENGVTRAQDYKTYAGNHIHDLTLRSLPGAAHLDVTFARSPLVAQWITQWLNAHQNP